MPDKRIVHIKKDNSKTVEIIHSDGSKDFYKGVDLPLGETVASWHIGHENSSGSGWHKDEDEKESKKKKG